MERVRKGVFGVISETRYERNVGTEDWLGSLRGTPGRTVSHGRSGGEPLTFLILKKLPELEQRSSREI